MNDSSISTSLAGNYNGGRGAGAVNGGLNIHLSKYVGRGFFALFSVVFCRIEPARLLHCSSECTFEQTSAV